MALAVMAMMGIDRKRGSTAAWIEETAARSQPTPTGHAAVNAEARCERTRSLLPTPAARQHACRLPLVCFCGRSDSGNPAGGLGRQNRPHVDACRTNVDQLQILLDVTQVAHHHLGRMLGVSRGDRVQQDAVVAFRA